MRTILVSLLVLTACDRAADFGKAPQPTAPQSASASSPPSTQPATRPLPPPAAEPGRANGLGFTIALPDGWVAQDVEEQSVFRAFYDGRGNIQILRLPESDRHVLASEHQCRSWIERTARTAGGTVTWSKLENDRCSALVAMKGMKMSLYAESHDSKAYSTICVGQDSSGDIRPECDAMLASWRASSAATPKRRQARVAISYEQDHPVVRGAGFRMTFPVTWKVVEGNGDSLVQGTTEDGGVLAVGLLPDFGVISRADCEDMGKPLADTLSGAFVGATLIRTPIGSGCRVEMTGAIFSWTIVATGPDNKTYMFGCGSTKGETPEVDCKAILESWRVP
jgi:hypothetical protein